MHEDDGGDGVVRAYKAEGGTAGVEGLGDYDAADDGGVDFWREVVGEKVTAGGVGPAPVEGESEEEDVAPVNEQCCAVVDELG